jgi:hypothetical protein
VLTRGVVVNLVSFHWARCAAESPPTSSSISVDVHWLKAALRSRSTPAAAYTCSEMTFMLDRLMVLSREIMVSANVAFSAGSSQQGKARRAAVGYVQSKHDERTVGTQQCTHRQLGQGVVLVRPVDLIC